MCSGNKSEWFAEWFDSPYYHALYKYRDQSEAASFLGNLLEYLSLHADARLLDLACGKGRHSFYLNSRGFDVTGVDLSPESIATAQLSANPKLRFAVADMRKLCLNTQFDVVFNLFTSFGYFESEEENLQVCKRVFEHLKPGGRLVLDYFNAALICPSHLGKMEKDADGFHFSMSKKIEGNRIYKDIEVTDGEKKFHFQEQVQLLNATMLHTLLKNAGFELQTEFGSYQLDAFEPGTSERLILIAKRP
jgi:SAM-dependent methyltransferase